MPTIVIEDGTGLANSNSYASGDELDTYCDDNGVTLTDSTDDAKDSALIRATAAIDGAYRLSFPGYRTLGRDQALEWPRTGAYDYEGWPIDTDAVPDEIKQAVFEAAIRENASAGSMTPDLERGGFIKRMKAGSVEIEYGGSNPSTVFTKIDSILSKLLSYGATNSSMFGATVRG